MLDPASELPPREQFGDVGGALFRQVSPRVWRRSEQVDRAHLLAGITAWLAGLWEVAGVGLFLDPDLLPEEVGAYEHADGRIVLNQAVTQDEDCHESIATVVHELRHAVQYHAIDDPHTHPLEAVGADEVARWAAAEVTYDEDVDDLTGYPYNALEVDAYAVESAVLIGYWKAAARTGRRFGLGGPP